MPFLTSPWHLDGVCRERGVVTCSLWLPLYSQTFFCVFVFVFLTFPSDVIGFCALPLLTPGDGFWSLPDGWKCQ